MNILSGPVVKKILNDFKVSITRESHNEIGCLCPFHDDHSSSFSINKNTGKWYCYTETKGGDITGLVMRLNKCSYNKAFKYIYGGDPYMQFRIKVASKTTPVQLIEEDFGEVADVVQIPKEAIKLDTIEKCPAYLLSRLQFDTIRRFKLGKIETGYYCNRIMIPVYENGTYVGFTTRDYSGTSNMKQLHPAGWSISKYVFNIDNIDATKPVIVVEGVFDAMYLVEKGFTNVVSIFGISFNMTRIGKLNKARVKDIILCFDNDAKSGAGQKAMDETLERINELFNVRYAELPTGKDPDEMTKEQLEQIFSNTKRME